MTPANLGTNQVEERIPPPVASMLSPLDRRAFGMAVGTLCGLGVFLVTIIDLLLRPQPGLSLGLLGQYFPGYAVTPGGALAGFAWGFGVGHCAGWFLAFVRNLAIAAWIFVVRSRHELTATRDFLDQI